MSMARKLMSAVALTLVLGACENDMVDPEDELSEEESVALLKGAGGLLAQVLVDSTLIQVNALPDSLVSRCPQGGQVKLVGTVMEDMEGDTIGFEVDMLITPTGCVVAADGMQFTVDPGPALRYRLLFEIIAATFEFNVTGMITGGLDWQLDDRSGNCTMDLTLEAVPDLSDPNAPGLTGVYKGSLCSHDVEIDAADLVVGL